MSSTFKQLFQAETVNAEKKIILSMVRYKNNEQTMMKQKIYENILVSRSGMN